MTHWKRVIEYAAPLWLIPIVLLNGYDSNTSFGWGHLRQPFSACWPLLITAIAWVISVMILRPLSTPSMPSHKRFAFIAALVGSWAIGLHVMHYGQNITPQGIYGDIAYTAFLPGAILVWGIRERLSVLRPRDLSLCAHCGYSRTGLAPGTPCPECGKLPEVAIASA